MRLDTDEIVALVLNLVDASRDYDKHAQVGTLHPIHETDVADAWRDFCAAVKAEQS